MDIQIDISDLKNTLIKRKVVYMGHTHDDDDKFTIIYCSIKYYDSEGKYLGSDILKNDFKNYKSGEFIELKVDDSITVNEFGKVDLNGGIGEYSFYMGLLSDFNSLINIGINGLEGVIRLGIQNAIEQGKFG